VFYTGKNAVYLPNRKTTRLEGIDYGAVGFYFVTICVGDRRESLGHLERDVVIQSPIGTAAEIELLWLQVRFDYVEVDTYQVMPDHLHVIIGITKNAPDTVCRRDFSKPQAQSLSMVMNHFKGTVTRYARRYVDPTFSWQGRFHDRVIRDFGQMESLREYITSNPKRLYLKRRGRDMPRGMSASPPGADL